MLVDKCNYYMKITIEGISKFAYSNERCLRNIFLKLGKKRN